MPALAEPGEAAGPLSVTLAYAAPTGCPGSAEFEAIVVERLGFDPFVARAPRRVLVSIAKAARAFEGRVEWRERDGGFAGDQAFPEHTSDCTDLARAMAFALAVQINLLSTRVPPDASSEIASSAETDSSAETAASPRVTPPAGTRARPSRADSRPPREARRAARRAGDPWARELGVGAALGFGLLPDTVALGRVSGQLGRGPLAFELAAETSSASSEQREDGAGFSVRVFLASAAACGVRGPFALCLLGKGGVLPVTGESIAVPESPSGLAAQLGLRLQVRQRFGRAYLAERLEGLVNLTRTTVTLDDVPVWTAPAFAATLGLDAGWSFR